MLVAGVLKSDEKRLRVTMAKLTKSAIGQSGISTSKKLLETRASLLVTRSY